MAESSTLVKAQQAAGDIHPADVAHTLTEAPEVDSREKDIDHARHHLKQNIKFFGSFLVLILLNVLAYSLELGSTYLVIFYILAGLRCGLMFWFLVSLVRPFSLVVAVIVFTIGFFAGMVGLTIWCEGDPILLPGQPLHPQK